MAAHVWRENYAVDHKQILFKQASNKQELTNWVNILITKNKDSIINFEIPPADHLTKKFILNLVEGSRSASTKNKEHKSQSCLENEDEGLQKFKCYKLIPIICKTSLLQTSSSYT